MNIFRSITNFLKRKSTAAYDSADHGKRLGNWHLSNSSINSLLASNFSTLRTRSHDIVRKNPYAMNSIEAIVSNIIQCFARMISNLINNSINACKEIKGQIDINFCISEGKAVFEIRDNGKGMSPAMVEKIMKRIPIESKGGHGLGMTQVFDTVDLYHGQLSLSSKEGKGSEFRIIFPLEGDYLSTKIFMPKNSTIVVIDRDSSIHPILTKLLSSRVDVQNMKIFANTSEALDFFNNVSEDEKSKIFVCIGYNESEVVDVLGILIRYNFLKQCLVITNSYNNLYSQEILKQTSIKIFPRQFLEYAEIILE